MSTHADCGEDILWVHRADDMDRFMPPLEFAGYRYVVVGEGQAQTAVQQPTYIVHHCNPEKVISWNAYKEELAAAKLSSNQIVQEARMSNYAAARERDRAEAWEYALKYDCPRDKCGAKVGEKCINIAQAKRGVDEFTKNPHPERVDPHWVDHDTQMADEGRD